jgi:glycosyltransferase involved in cell wall biosynthesis
MYGAKLLSLGLKLLGFATGAYEIYFRRVFEIEYPDYEPPQTSIILPTLNEEKYVEECLTSLKHQTIRVIYPEKFEVIVVDSGSRDSTLDIASRFDVEILEAPLGKLTARHIGIQKAKGEIIVAVDADTVYPFNWLNLVLRHFLQKDVVAVSTPGIFPEKILDIPMIWKALTFDPASGRLPGSGSAFRREAYFKSGGFNLSINQFNGAEIQMEEEYEFPRRLRKHGRIIYELSAPHFTSPRRHFGHKSSF